MTPRIKQAVSGFLQNIEIQCLIPNSNPFWIINGDVYGLLQVPRDFVVCGEEICNLLTLKIPVAQEEMNGSTFQCISIDYHSNTFNLGFLNVLVVTTVPYELNG